MRPSTKKRGRLFGHQSLKCSFCGKSQDEVKELVAGSKAFICDECVATAVKVMEAHPPYANSGNEEKSASKVIDIDNFNRNPS